MRLWWCATLQLLAASCVPAADQCFEMGMSIEWHYPSRQISFDNPLRVSVLTSGDQQENWEVFGPDAQPVVNVSLPATGQLSPPNEALLDGTNDFIDGSTWFSLLTLEGSIVFSGGRQVTPIERGLGTQGGIASASSERPPCTRAGETVEQFAIRTADDQVVENGEAVVMTYNEGQYDVVNAGSFSSIDGPKYAGFMMLRDE